MPPVPLVPLVMRDVELLFGDLPAAPDYRHHTNVASWTPSATPVRVSGLGGKTFLANGDTQWALDLAVAQDWTTEESLSNYLYEHEGEIVTVTVRPRSGVGPSFRQKVLIQPTAIGGTGGQEARSAISLPAEGKPEKVAGA
jgi:hypothetical protein